MNILKSLMNFITPIFIIPRKGREGGCSIKFWALIVAEISLSHPNWHPTLGENKPSLCLQKMWKTQMSRYTWTNDVDATWNVDDFPPTRRDKKKWPIQLKANIVIFPIAFSQMSFSEAVCSICIHIYIWICLSLNIWIWFSLRVYPSI
jgi:hypothetical protein